MRSLVAGVKSATSWWRKANARSARYGIISRESGSRPKPARKKKHAAIARIPGRPAKPAPKLANSNRRVAAEIGEIVRKRAEAEAAIAEARKSHERLRQAIDILPQGIVFLDAEGRYILWNRKYAEIYNRSSDLFKPGAAERRNRRSAACPAWHGICRAC